MFRVVASLGLFFYKMIVVSTLPQIVSPEHFFNADKILFINFHEQFPTTKVGIEWCKKNPDIVEYKDRFFMSMRIKGSPQNMFIKLKEFKDLFDGDLEKAIANGQLFDFSAQYRTGEMDFMIENEWYIEKYIRKIVERTAIIKVKVENGKVVDF